LLLFFNFVYKFSKINNTIIFSNSLQRFRVDKLFLIKSKKPHAETYGFNNY